MQDSGPLRKKHTKDVEMNQMAFDSESLGVCNALWLAWRWGLFLPP